MTFHSQLLCIAGTCYALTFHVYLAYKTYTPRIKKMIYSFLTFTTINYKLISIVW